MALERYKDLTGTLQPIGVPALNVQAGPQLSEQAQLGRTIAAAGANLSNIAFQEKGDRAEVAGRQAGLKDSVQFDPNGKLIPFTGMPSDDFTIYGQSYAQAATENYRKAVILDTDRVAKDLARTHPGDPEGFRTAINTHIRKTLEVMHPDLAPTVETDLNAIGASHFGVLADAKATQEIKAAVDWKQQEINSLAAGMQESIAAAPDSPRAYATMIDGMPRLMEKLKQAQALAPHLISDFDVAEAERQLKIGFATTILSNEAWQIGKRVEYIGDVPYQNVGEAEAWADNLGANWPDQLAYFNTEDREQAIGEIKNFVRQKEAQFSETQRKAIESAAARYEDKTLAIGEEIDSLYKQDDIPGLTAKAGEIRNGYFGESSTGKRLRNTFLGNIDKMVGNIRDDHDTAIYEGHMSSLGRAYDTALESGNKVEQREIETRMDMVGRLRPPAISQTQVQRDIDQAAGKKTKAQNEQMAKEELAKVNDKVSEISRALAAASTKEQRLYILRQGRDYLNSGAVPYSVGPEQRVEIMNAWLDGVADINIKQRDDKNMADYTLRKDKFQLDYAAATGDPEAQAAIVDGYMSWWQNLQNDLPPGIDPVTHAANKNTLLSKIVEDSIKLAAENSDASAARDILASGVGLTDQNHANAWFTAEVEGRVDRSTPGGFIPASIDDLNPLSAGVNIDAFRDRGLLPEVVVDTVRQVMLGGMVNGQPASPEQFVNASRFVYMMQETGGPLIQDQLSGMPQGPEISRTANYIARHLPGYERKDWDKLIKSAADYNTTFQKENGTLVESYMRKNPQEVMKAWAGTWNTSLKEGNLVAGGWQAVWQGLTGQHKWSAKLMENISPIVPPFIKELAPSLWMEETRGHRPDQPGAEDLAYAGGQASPFAVLIAGQPWGAASQNLMYNPRDPVLGPIMEDLAIEVAVRMGISPEMMQHNGGGLAYQRELAIAAHKAGIGASQVSRRDGAQVLGGLSVEVVSNTDSDASYEAAINLFNTLPAEDREAITGISDPSAQEYYLRYGMDGENQRGITMEVDKRSYLNGKPSIRVKVHHATSGWINDITAKAHDRNQGWLPQDNLLDPYTASLEHHEAVRGMSVYAALSQKSNTPMSWLNKKLLEGPGGRRYGEIMSMFAGQSFVVGAKTRNLLRPDLLPKPEYPPVPAGTRR
jgi:hypothetical protein